MMSRMRYLNQYGDYLAVSLERFRTASFKGWLWSDSDWIRVAEALDIEDTLLAEARERRRRGGGWEMLPRPFHKQLEEAAKRLGSTEDHLAYEIRTYALRNRLAHNGIRKLIDECRWQELAERTMDDLQFLHLAFGEASGVDHIKMRKTIKDLQAVYLETIYVEQDGRVLYTPTDLALKKTHARRERLISRDQGERA